MPEHDGKLTPEEMQKVEELLKPFPGAIGTPCPVCGETDWALAEHLLQALAYSPNGLDLSGGITYPSIALVSQRCGYTKLLNAVVLGLLPRSKSDE